MRKQITTLVITGLSISGLAVAPAVFAKDGFKGGSKPFGLPMGRALNKIDHHINMIEGEAAFLGISVDDLKARIASGKTIKQIIQELGITQEQITAKMEARRTEELTKRKEEIQARVASGKITQAEADKLIERLSQPHEHGPGKFKAGNGPHLFKPKTSS